MSKNGKNYDFETGIYRPPSEGGSYSLLVRFTRNCPWNRCGFCGMYKAEKFQVRSVEEIKSDIDAMARLCEDLKAVSHRIGHSGRIDRSAASALMKDNPQLGYHQGFQMIYAWLLSGAKTAFLQDANSVIMKTDRLVEALQHLRKTFPSIDRVTSYARSKTVAQKSLDELASICTAGLDRLHVGMESGDDAVLEYVQKGVTSEGHIRAGRKALAAGFQLSEYWMPGLGGKALWKAHADNTARVLNQIDPHYIRSRPFHPWPGTPIYDQMVSGGYRMLTPTEQLIELKRTIQALDVTSRVCFDHAGNYWKNGSGAYIFSHGYEGYKFPEEKKKVLDAIEEGLSAAGRGQGA